MTKVEVDEVLGLVGYVGTEVAAYDAVPCGVVLLVEFFLDEGGDVLLDVKLLEGLGADVDSVLLHVQSQSPPAKMSSCPFCDLLIPLANDVESHTYDDHLEEATNAGWKICTTCKVALAGTMLSTLL